jgi:nucleoside-diphosphate-sugar epimerase
MGERILVTGASGLVGSAVAAALRARGDDVVAVDRIPSERDGVVVAECELTDVHRLHELTRAPERSRGIDAVVHCGAFSGPMVGRDRPHAMVEANVVGTANVLELARLHECRRFVFTSSATVYGRTEGGPVTERTLPNPGSLYAATKVASEQLVAAYASDFGLDGVSLRLGWVYGPRRTTDCVVRTMITDAQAGMPTRMPFGRGFPRQFIHVDDTVAVLLTALDAAVLPQRVYNATGGTRVTLDALGDLVAGVLPGADVELADGPDPLDTVQDEMDLTAIARDLDWRPAVALQDGIASYAQWLAATGGSARTGTAA